MRFLLDTHALLWWFFEPSKLGRKAHDVIEDGANEIIVSAVSAMEITTKYRIGKLPDAQRLAWNFSAEVSAEQFVDLPINLAHASLAGSLDISHKDPFDRLLIAQAQIENVPLISNEKLFDAFGITRIW